jgi:hypothetical protein
VFTYSPPETLNAKEDFAISLEGRGHSHRAEDIHIQAMLPETALKDPKLKGTAKRFNNLL